MVSTSVLVSATLTVIAISAAIAVMFGMSDDFLAATYNYSFRFTTDWFYPDGTVYSTGSGEVVVNGGVQVRKWSDSLFVLILLSNTRISFLVRISRTHDAELLLHRWQGRRYHPGSFRPHFRLSRWFQLPVRRRFGGIQLGFRCPPERR